MLKYKDILFKNMANRFEKPGGFEAKTDTQGKKPEKGQENTFYFRKFDAKEKKEREVQLNNIGQKEKKERAEAMQQRFLEMAMMLEGGEVRKEVIVANEKHSMAINGFGGFLKDGRPAKTEDLVHDVDKNPKTLDHIAIKFNLQWTAGRDENLILDCKIPANEILSSGKDAAEAIKNKITGIFAGTSRHYENIRSNKEQQEQKEQNEPPETTVSNLEKAKKIKESLEQKGAGIVELSGSGRETIIGDFPELQKQVIITRTGGVSQWNIDLIEKNNIERSYVTNQPEETLPEITKFVEVT